MASRWEVERALVWSNIRPMARLLVFALATKANSATGVIPDEHTPSLGTLAAMTGASRSVVAEQLKYLTNLGWVKLSAPAKRSRYDRNLYELMVGNPDPARPSSPCPGPLDESEQDDSGPGAGPLPAVREPDRSPSADIDPAVREPDGLFVQQSGSRTANDQPSGPAPGLATTNTKPKTKRTTATRKPRAAGASVSSSSSNDPEDPNAGAILAAWIDYCTEHNIKLPGRTVGHYAKEIKTALDQGFAANHIKKALAEMFAQNATSSPSQLPKFLIEIQTGPRKWPARAAPDAYRNPESQDDYDDWTKNAPPAHR